MDILDTLSVANANATTVNANRFGKIGSDGNIAQCVAGDSPDGIIQYTTDGGTSLMYDGILPLAAAGALSAGVEVVPDANGRAVLCPGGTAAAGRLVNNTTAAAQDDIVEVQFYRRGQRVKPGVGAVIASATTIAAASLTNDTHHVSGTTAIGTITVPAGFPDGGQLNLIPDAIETSPWRRRPSSAA